MMKRNIYVPVNASGMTGHGPTAGKSRSLAVSIVVRVSPMAGGWISFMSTSQAGGYVPAVSGNTSN